MKNMWKGDDDPTRCDWSRRRAVPNLRQSSTIYPTPTAPIVDDSAVDDSADDSEDAEDPTATLVKLHDLARRSPSSTITDECRKTYTITTSASVITFDTSPKDMRHVQADWERHLRDIHSTCAPRFWHIFLQVHTFPVNVIDTILHAAKTTFVAKNSTEWKKFPPSRRALLNKANSSDDFWPAVLHTCEIDLTTVLKKNLVSGTRSLTFQFLDPVWAWLTVATNLPPEDLHWKPAAQDRLDPVYGGGIQFGECFREACKSCPPGAYPMCISLHWDGTSGGGISSDPICIGVMNTNNCGAETQCCIGYMPQVPDQARPEFAKTRESTTLKFHIRQECCRAILRVLESAATRGVVCTLYNQDSQPVDRLLFARLVAMNFDQPEAQLFYGWLRVLGGGATSTYSSIYLQ